MTRYEIEWVVTERHRVVLDLTPEDLEWYNEDPSGFLADYESGDTYFCCEDREPVEFTEIRRAA